jgi:hypothetical protein
LAAASIISPMMERPETVFSSFTTVISLRNFDAVSTNFAEARACNPRWFTIAAFTLT